MSLYDPDVWARVQTLAGTVAARGADAGTAEQRAWAHLSAIVEV